MATRRISKRRLAELEAERTEHLNSVPWAAPEYRVVSYLRTTTPDGTHWLPRDIIGKDAKTLIVYRPADREYAIDGWETWHDGMFGGRYETVQSAFAWDVRAREVRAGTAKDFLGV